MRYQLSITEIVSFVCMHGDLTGDLFQNVSTLEGIKAHQHIQSRYDTTDQKELTLKLAISIDDLDLDIQGRLDGLINQNLIEEIKSTKKPLELLTDYDITHYTQLSMYAYMYMDIHNIKTIKARLTYVNLETYKTKYFHFSFEYEEAKTFFYDTLQDYIIWLKLVSNHEKQKLSTTETLAFPFKVYRKGQRAFMKSIYHTLSQSGILYAIAPTGIGKTMGAIFSSIKTLKKSNDKLFYLTAKTEGKKVAIEAANILLHDGLALKVLELTAKDPICFLEKRNCDPDVCPFSKGFFDRLKDAMKDIFQHENLMDRKTIEAYAIKHQVCPFEFSLSISNYVDLIICDYNYVFDPKAHLVRYFDEDDYRPILLIDEAHNLISRSKDMFSSTLLKSDFIELRRLLRKVKPNLTYSINKVITILDGFEHEGFKEFDTPNLAFIERISILIKKIQKVFESINQLPQKSLILDLYFKLLQFDRIYTFYNEAYKTNVVVDSDISITLQCLDAAAFLHHIIKKKTYGTIFFSATLYPIEYHKQLLSKGEGESIVIQSPFDKKRLKIVQLDIDTRYNKRDASVMPIIEAIQSLLSSRVGNYICFLPSYQYLTLIHKALPKLVNTNLFVQKKDMAQQERNDILDVFKKDSLQSNLALFVMGGMFSEGIDYVGDMLNGVIVVGVGLPGFNEETEQLSIYNDQKFQNGFHYTYTYPGMTKVIQSVGRLIRRQTDFGVAILIDSRFQTSLYQSLMPKHWHPVKKVDTIDLKAVLDQFWTQYLN